jgi:hypothetical protein
MNPALAGVALAVTAGAVIAASSREARAALIGLALVLGLGPFLAEPMPDAAIVGARVVTGILIVYLLWAVAARSEARGLGSRIGWPAVAVLATAAVIAGVAMAAGLESALQGGADGAGGAVGAGGAGDPGGVGDAGGGGGTDLLAVLTPSAVALAAGLAALVVGLGPAFFGRSALQTGVGLLLVVQGLVLARTGLAGPPGALEQLGIDGLVLTLGASAALVAIIERRSGSDGDRPGGRSTEGASAPRGAPLPERADELLPPPVPPPAARATGR